MVEKAEVVDNPRIPGNRAMWVGIYAELTEFALMFLVYFAARSHHPDAFRDGPQQLSILAGITNTLVMVTSSYFVARALFAIRAGRNQTCMRWLAAAFVTGMAYPLVKFFEVRWNVAHGVDGSSGDVFQMTYYYLTFNHLVHVSWGLLGMAWVMFRTWTGAYSVQQHHGLEAFASYWHATDLIWLMIFPLVYVLN